MLLSLIYGKHVDVLKSGVEINNKITLLMPPILLQVKYKRKRV